MKILFNYGGRPKSIIDQEIRGWVNAGYEISPVNHQEELNLEWLSWPQCRRELKKLYYAKDRKLFKLYKKIKDLAETHDVFLVFGEHLYHPEFVKSLRNIYTVIVEGDDPDSSEFCSKPYVHSFDHSFTSGVNYNKSMKIREKYLEWGAKRADWWPYGVWEYMYDPSLTEEDIYNEDRPIDLMFAGSPWENRLERLAKIKKAFPQMRIHGRGYLRSIGRYGLNALRRGSFSKTTSCAQAIFRGLWRVKRSPIDELVRIYQRCKIGINLHISFGPSNTRTYQLPANGVMQICDCSEGLGEVFEIGEEVVAYDSIDEAIALIRYYLEHDDEREKIAAAGFKRVMKDYKRTTTIFKAIERIKKGMLEGGISYLKDGTRVKF